MAVDLTTQSKNYHGLGGGNWVVGGNLEIASGGTLQVDAGASLTYGAGSVVMSGITRAGQHTVLAGEVTATHADSATGLTALSAMSVMIIRANKVATLDATITFSAGAIVVAAGSSYALTAGDIINWIAVGS